MEYREFINSDSGDGVIDIHKLSDISSEEELKLQENFDLMDVRLSKQIKVINTHYI